jgi:peptide/nickel transport system substrate-binding protein
VQFFKDVPFYPLGQLFNPIAYRDGVSGILDGGFVLFWNVHKS